jgi:pilus assembly protein Flp/PilA
MNLAAITRIFRDESGASAIEYALIGALVSLAAIIAMTAMGSSLRVLFEQVTADFTAAVN